MKKQGLNYLLTLAIFLGMSSLAPQAVSAIFVLTPQGTLPTQVPVDGQVTASYTVYNNTPFVSPDNGLNYTGNAPDTTPAGVTQNTSASSNPPTCADPFTLSPYGSCTLVLTISGADLVNGQAIGGPKVCNTKDNPTICVLPDLNERLNVTTFTPGVPTVTGVSPNAGSPSGDTNVTITGTNFYGATAVTFDGTNATNVNVVSATQITATSPAGTSGTTVDVTVTTPEGTSPANPPYDQFTFEDAPTITSLIPDNGPTGGGTSITLNGTNLLTASKVTFGATVVECGVPPFDCVVNSSAMPPTITVVSPAAASPGAVDVTVTTTIGQSNAVTYTYGAGPTVTNVSPNTGPSTGNTAVTIMGTNFIGVTDVMFGDTSVGSYTVVDSTEITTTSPAQGTMEEVVDVTVTNAQGTSPTSADDQFTYESTGVTAAVAVGIYGNGNPPLIMLSADNGSSWSSVNLPNLPANLAFPTVESISCYNSGVDCIAVGYSTPGNYNYPFILTSSDSGSSWTLVSNDEIAWPTDITSATRLLAIYCAENGNCITVGYYTADSDRYTLSLIMGNTNCGTGISWCAVSASEIEMPDDSSDGTPSQLSAISCNGVADCIAAGYYTNMSSVLFPLILTNTGSCGETWCAVQSEDIFVPSDAEGENAPVQTIDCDYAAPSFCIAAGEYVSNISGATLPLILNSVDGGDTWDGVSQAQIQQPADFAVVGLISSVYCNSANCTMVGYYLNESSSQYPYILYNCSSTPYTWCQPTNITLPPDYAGNFGAGGLYAVNCAAENGADIICTGIGSYYNDSVGDTLPLMLNSTDSSQDWSPGSYTLPTDYSSNTSLYAGTCTAEGICTAGGYYLNTVGDVTAALFLSTADGFIWNGSEPTSITYPSEYEVGSAVVTADSCDGADCVAVGYYANSNTFANEPWILNSSDSGSTWTSVSSSDISLTAGGELYELDSVSCDGSNCTVVGIFYDTLTGKYSGLILSNTGCGVGFTWCQVAGSDITLPAYAAYQLASITCSAGDCAAVGNYTDNNSNTYPLILSNTATGTCTTTWCPASSVQTPTEPVFVANGSLYSVSCNGAACVAVGSYDTLSGSAIPLILYSTNSYTTSSWLPINNVPLPGDYDANAIAQLNSVSCNATGSGIACTAVGYYSGDSGQFMLVLNGSYSSSVWNWAVLEPDDFIEPNDYSSDGTLQSVVCDNSGATCTAVGSYENTLAQSVPLIINSLNSGSMWSSVESSDITEPDDFASEGILYGVSGG